MIAQKIRTTDQRSKLLRDYGNTIDINSGKFDEKAGNIAQYVSGKKPKNNKESKSIIMNFIDNVDVSTLMAVFTMFGTIITTAISLYRNLRKFNDGTAYNSNRNNVNNFNRHSRLFESDDLSSLLNEADILEFVPLDYSNMKQIYESEDFQNLPEETKNQLVDELSDKSIKSVIDNDSLKFTFEGGAQMEALNSNELSTLNFSLRYHVNKTENVSEFIKSVEEYLKLAEQDLTEFDKESLIKHYTRYK